MMNLRQLNVRVARISINSHTEKDTHKGDAMRQQSTTPPTRRGPRFLTAIALATTIALLATIAPTAAQFVEGNTETQKLFAPNADLFDVFGGAVAIDGDTMAIAAPGRLHRDFDTDTGAVFIYRQTGDSWVVDQELSIPANPNNGSDLTDFGTSIAIDGDTMIVGAPGSNGGRGVAYVFTQNGGVWSQSQRILPSDSGRSDRFGASSAISGNTIAIGAPGHSNELGSAFVFVQTDDGWVEQAQLEVPAESEVQELFAHSIAVDGNTIAVGMPGDDEDHNRQGSVRVFVRDGTTWTQQQALFASDAARQNELGTSVAIDGDTIIAGAPFRLPTGIDDQSDGAAYIFSRTGDAWTEDQQLVVSSSESLTFGISIDIEADSAVIGAGDFPNPGAVFHYALVAGSWQEQTRFVGSDATIGEEIGRVVAFDGDTIIAGAPGDDDAGSFAGSAYVFNLSGGTSSFCDGHPITVDLRAGDVPTDGDDVIAGTDGRDVINAGDGDDIICARAGADIINGGSGADVIFGGNGDDIISAGDGPDIVWAGRGDDEVFGGQGSDELRGQDGADFISGGKGKDLLIGGIGGDDLRGNEGTDDLRGGQGNDTLRGGQKADVIEGNGGDDTLIGGTRPDILDGNAGVDTYVGGSGSDICVADRAGRAESTTSCEL